ncbi:ubiquitin-related domain-containing protein [Gymnopilus junonius]|uniref:Ubiquitin-related domain-containing protein n=1 Tax=Gymnopilus junonius TaxID=109634 RepID=A0A9P5NW07_GYMJU|nr:ubiquitin-related domain-containing protein [Gymnopilus junonius]
MQELAVDEVVPQMPQTYLTFLLISGKRRTMSFEPETAIGRVKELVWNAWPSDWQDDRPPAPSYLRVLYYGRLLQDDETLTTGPTPTIMHLSIRPYAPPNEDNSATNEPLDVADSAGCCRCIIC